ncbi:MAG: methyltransferase domain-containing protein [Planctomycetales bacterium]|nr:methyltransferase domain-containing protein [Planctomycetales bacterium]
MVSPAVAQKTTVAPVEGAKLGETKNVHQCGNLFLAGQPTEEDFANLRQNGVTRIITLRADSEIDFDEAAKSKAAGLEFVSMPIDSPDAITDDFLGELRKLLSDKGKPTLLHCGSANRVGAVWMAHRVLDEGVDLETALAEAKEVGLRSEAMESRVKEYIVQQSTNSIGEQSVNPGINDRFLDPALDIKEWVERFEVESREVFGNRDRVLAAMQLKPGMIVADVGAGTGAFTRVFSKAVGPEGWVYAVDISPKFLEHISSKSAEENLGNVSAVFGSAKSINLPPASVDVIFICDTYHHFEYPESTLASINKALKPGGVLVLIDFERIPGKSREWTLSHVRAGKDVFRQEVEAAGFALLEEVKVEGFEENYFLRLQKR